MTFAFPRGAAFWETWCLHLFVSGLRNENIGERSKKNTQGGNFLYMIPRLSSYIFPSCFSLQAIGHWDKKDEEIGKELKHTTIKLSSVYIFSSPRSNLASSSSPHSKLLELCTISPPSSYILQQWRRNKFSDLVICYYHPLPLPIKNITRRDKNPTNLVGCSIVELPGYSEGSLYLVLHSEQDHHSSSTKIVGSWGKKWKNRAQQNKLTSK